MSTGNGRRNARRNGRQTPVQTPALVPQPHGGALQVGNPGNIGGGRPPSAIRAAFRKSLDRRLPVLETIADGDPTERIEVSLAAILPHVSCPKCGGELTTTGKVSAVLVAIQAKVSAKARDRVMAVAEMAGSG